jgi:outer membrane lipoprotein-sorting protein
MTHEPSWKEHVVRLSGVWIDSRGDAEPPAIAPVRPEIQDEAAQRYLADLLLVDSLLANLSPGAVDRREQRIQRVMHALDDHQVTPVPRSRLRRWSPVLAVAALLLIVVTGSWIQLARKSLADDVLLAVNEVSSEIVDRVYTIQRVLGSGGEQDAPQGRLYLRGRRGFVISLDQAVLGRHGDQFWVVAPPRNVYLSADFQWIDARSTCDEVGLRFVQTLSLESRHIPLMQLASVAELMRHDYDVTLHRSRLGRHATDLLVGQRRSHREDLPVTIRLWSDPRSRIVQRAELDWEPGNSVILELLPAEQVPDGWYDHQTHCRGEPVVRHMPQER